MAERIHHQIRSNVVGYIALFCFAMGGTAWATHPGGANTISSGDIINGEVKNGDLGADSVASGKIADQQVKNADLGTGASSSNTIADGGIQAVDVKNNTLTGTQIAESTLAGLWFLGGNAGTGASDFLGTTDNQPLDLRVNGARALRLEPASDGTNQSPNVIGGSADNSVAAGVHSATIGGGGRFDPDEPLSANTVVGDFGTIGGGADNRVFARLATVAGGGANTASGDLATIGGGFLNTASGAESTVVGGDSNTAQGDLSLAAGFRARANHEGAFVWADSNTLDFPSTNPNEFSVRSTGGARFVSAIDGTGAPTAGVSLAPGGGSWSSLSDEASKRAVEPVSGREVLRELASVPISTWSYRSQEDSIRHIGPMAQDFYRAFGVGEDRRHIASVDADGVALAAVKGLNRKLTAKVDRLERRLASLERRLGSAR